MRKFGRRSPEPGRWGYVFIVTYGRSGSTLLQGILNSIPGYVIRGENGGAVKHLWRFQQEMQHWRSVRKKPIPLPKSNSWYGIDGFDSGLCAERIRTLVDETVLHPPEGTRVAGFKEVRYLDEDTGDYVRWMADTFPGAKFVFNSRRLDAVARSEWWQEDDQAAERLLAADTMLAELRDSLGERALGVRYDDFTADVNALQPLFAWLGEPFDAARLQSVLDKKHGY